MVAGGRIDEHVLDVLERLRAGHGDFVGLAVAVGILVSEGGQHLHQLVIGVGRGHADGVQPVLIDPAAAGRGHVVVGEHVQRRAVDVAIHAGDLLEQVVRVEAEGGAQVAIVLAVVVKIVVQRHQHALAAPLVCGGGVHAEGQHVGQLVAAGDHQVELGLRVGGREEHELQLHVGALEQPLGQRVVLIVVDQRGLLQCNGQRRRLLQREGHVCHRGGRDQHQGRISASSFFILGSSFFLCRRGGCEAIVARSRPSRNGMKPHAAYFQSFFAEKCPVEKFHLLESFHFSPGLPRSRPRGT